MAQQDAKKHAPNIENNTITNTDADANEPIKVIRNDAQEEPARQVKFRNELINGAFVAVYK